MSRILSTISMLTGHTSSQARHVVHAHSSSDVIRSNTLSDVTVMPASTPTGGDTAGVPERAATSPSLSTISRGSSGLPVMLAGHTAVHSPQAVHASVSRSCFHVKSAMTDAPTVSISSASRRFGISRIAPLGRSRGPSAMFTGEVTACLSFVVGSMTRNTRNRRACVAQKIWCKPDATVDGIRPAMAVPTNDQLSQSGTPMTWMRAPSTKRPDTPIAARSVRIQKSSGRVLDRIRQGLAT